MTVDELMEKLSKEDPDTEVCILRSHKVGGVTYHEILGPNKFYGFSGLCLSAGEPIYGDSEAKQS